MTTVSPRKKVLGVHRALSILYLGLGGLLLFLGQDGSANSLVGPAVLLLAVFAVYAGIAIGCARRSSWARPASQIVGAILLLGVPIGTLIGGYLLYQARKLWEAEEQTNFKSVERVDPVV